MSDFTFLDNDNKIKMDSPINSESDLISMYFKKRQESARNSIGSSSRSSTISLLSLNRASFSDEPHEVQNQSKPAPPTLGVFKKPKTPPKKESTATAVAAAESLKATLSKADDVLQRFMASDKENTNLKHIFTCSSPQTPRPFVDELSSITSEVSRSEGSELFPVREEKDILNLLEKDEKKFAPNSSGFSHNSDLTHFSSPSSINLRGTSQKEPDQISIGEYFGVRSDRINSIVKNRGDFTDLLDGNGSSNNKTLENDTSKSISTIHNLLSDDKLSGSALCEQLLKKYPTQWNNVTHDASQLRMDRLSESRQSTPVACRMRLPQDSCSTPLRKRNDWQPGRLQLNASHLRSQLTNLSIAPNEGDNENVWQQLRETQNHCSGGATFLDGADRDAADQSMAAGNITAVSQRIGTLTMNNTLSLGSPLLDIIHKLAQFPDGSVDCRALTPMLREQFPQLLEEDECKMTGNTTLNCTSVRELLSSEPEGWISYNRDPQTMTACVQTKKIVSMPMASKGRWLLARITAVELLTAGATLQAEQQEETWVAEDLLTLQSKPFVLPPNIQHNLQFTIIAHKPFNAALRLTLIATDMNSSEEQKIVCTVFQSAVLPPHGFSLSPSPTANFGTLPESCSEERSFKLTYQGDCDIPIIIFLQQDYASENPFCFCNSVSLNGIPVSDTIIKDNSIEIILLGGAKQTLEFNIGFHPSVLTGLQEKHFINFNGELTVEVQTTTNGRVIVARTKLEGTVAFAKFLCRTECSPLIFNTDASRVPMTKHFYIKNVGVIPLKIALTVRIASNDSSSEEEVCLFTMPPVLALPLEECVSFPIVFSPCSGVNYYRRFLIMTLEPNGTTNYDVELIGTVPPESLETALPSSRASIKSGSTVLSTNGVAVKLHASTSALSWVATPLQKCVQRSFQVKMKSEQPVVARISINPDLGVFKIISDKGEALSKTRKTLKPNVPLTINVQFQPDSVGLHRTAVTFSFPNSSDPSSVKLTGFGGAPKLKVEDTHLDLHGNRMVKLAHPRLDQFVFSAQFRITNYGNTPGFVFISSSTNVLSITHSLKVYPLRAVVLPSSNVIINVSQHLSRSEFQEVLAGQDIKKIASLNLLMGDEPSRLRLRKHISRESGVFSDHLKNLVDEFPGEQEFKLDGITESKNFQSLLMSSAQSSELVVVVEKSSDTRDETVVDINDTSCSFATISNTIICRPQTATVHDTHKKSANSSYVSGHSQESAEQKVKDWLRKVE